MNYSLCDEKKSKKALYFSGLSILFILLNIILNIEYGVKISEIVKRKYGMSDEVLVPAFDFETYVKNYIGMKEELLPIKSGEVYKVVNDPIPSPCKLNCGGYLPGDNDYLTKDPQPETGFHLHYDIYRRSSQEDKKLLPVILHFHGGGWKTGVRQTFQRNYRGGLAHLFVEELNLMVISFSYRLMRDGWNGEHISSDVEAAIEFTRRNCENFGCDPNKIILFGTSAGGHLVLNTALKKNFENAVDIQGWLKGVISMYPPTDLRRSKQYDLRGLSVDQVYHWGLELMSHGLCSHFLEDVLIESCFNNLSPIHHAEMTLENHENPIFPPVLVVHGQADGLVSPSSSSKLIDVLNKDGTDMHLHVSPPFADHDCDTRNSSPCSQMAVYAARQMLKKILKQ